MNKVEKDNINYRFGKQYKLCSKKLIDQLFNEGNELKNFPFILKYTACTIPNNIAPFQVVFVVPKKKFRLATTRNKIKRLMREAVRMKKQPLEDALNRSNQQLALFLLYLGKSSGDFDVFEQKINVLLSRLAKEIEHEN